MEAKSLGKAKFSHVLWNPTFYYHMHKSHPLNKMNAVYTQISYFMTVNVNACLSPSVTSN